METIKQFVAVKGFIFYDGKILLLRESSRYQDGTNVGKWDVPGGRINPGENFQTAFIREVKEETGLEVKFGKPFFMSEWFPKPRGESWHVVATFVSCNSYSDIVQLSEDHDMYQWLLLEQVLQLDNLSTGIKEAVIEYIKIKPA